MIFSNKRMSLYHMIRYYYFSQLKKLDTYELTVYLKIKELVTVGGI